MDFKVKCLAHRHSRLQISHKFFLSREAPLRL